MRRSLLVCLVLLATAAAAQDKKAPRDADLGKKSSTSVDKSLAGDISRKKDPKEEVAPSLQYDQFRLGVEFQVASKRREQIASLKKIISLSPDPKETPSLLFRLGELYWEESKFFFFEANRKDDDLIQAMNRNDAAGQQRAKAEKAELTGRSKQYGKLAVEQYTKIVQEYPDFERSDEVLYFLGVYLMEEGENRKALVAFKRLVEKYPKSKYLPDAYLAFGEYYFNNSKGKRTELEKALVAYKKAAEFPESQVYAFALYKQGWCHFNMGDFAQAKDKFKTVVLYGELAGAAAVEKDGGKSGKSTLIKEARADYVRTYAREGDVLQARDDFSKVATNPDDRFTMMKQLANLYYGDGKDREAALTYNTLIKEKPLSPEAPGFQAKIVDCVLRMGNKERTVSQVRRLVKIVKDVEGAGVIREDKDKKALEEARELAERTLSNLAVTWHNEAKKTRDEETFRYADAIYGDYLTLFPENPKAYDLRFFWAELLNDHLQNFEKAAANYTLVVLQDAKVLEAKDEAGNPKPGKPGKWLHNAAYNAVLAYDEVVKLAEQKGEVKSETGTDITKKVAIPTVKKGLLDACERYLKYVTKGDKWVEIAFKAANIYYRHNHFDEAVQRFSEIALNHPEHKFENGERAAEISANLILDSYNLLKDYAKVNEWARRFYANDKLASGKFREDLAKVIEQSAFMLVAELEAKKEFAKAAEAYLTFVKDFPETAIADQALYNASVDYFKAKMLDKSIEVRQRLIAQYPGSKFVPDCIYANAEAQEAIGDFAQSADTYEAYVRGYERHLADKGGGRAKKGNDKPAAPQKWEEAKAQVALFNAATYRDGLGQHKQALANRERYLMLWPRAKDAEQIHLSIADLLEKTGAHYKALTKLEEYEREYMRSASKYLSAEGRIVRIFEKLNKPKDIARLYNRIWEHYEQLPKRVQKELEPSALAPVGQAHFLTVEADYAHYSRMKLGWGRPVSPEHFKGTIAEKKKSLDWVARKYTQTVAIGAPEPAICALYRIGMSYDNFVDRLVNAPMPAGLDEETQQAIRDEFSNEAQPLRDQAAELFGAAVAKARELEVFNECAVESLKKLRTVYRPEAYPEMPEDKVAMVKGSDRILGGDVLTAIQDVPPPVAEVVPQKEAEAQALQEDLTDLTQRLRQQTETDVNAPAPASKKDAKKPSADSDEPEDFL
jgi:tetratricopeptide (TPR) repeat protein